MVNSTREISFRLGSSKLLTIRSHLVWPLEIRIQALKRCLSSKITAKHPRSQVGVDRDSSPRRKRTFDPEKALPVFNSDQPLRPARNPPKALLSDYIGFLRCFRPVIRFIRGRKAKDPALSNRINPSNVESTVPLEIILYLNSYLAWLLGNGLLQAAIATSMVNNLTAMQDTLTHLARIRNTPLPFAYQAHLRISLW